MIFNIIINDFDIYDHGKADEHVNEHIALIL